MQENCIAIIDQLIERRRQLGMTQIDLANATGFTQSVIARLGRKKNVPQLNTLLRVASALKCDLTIVPAQGKTP